MNPISRRRHWTPRYLTDRLAEFRYQKRNPDLPWLTKDANSILETYLHSDDVGVEFGSGRSTIWLATHVKHLTSIEHDHQWHSLVRTNLALHCIENVTYHHEASNTSPFTADRSGYVRILDKFDEESLDFALVDGVYRDHCCNEVIDKLRPGGCLILDNANRYIPHETRSPHSQPIHLGPSGPVWREVSNRLSTWRFIWTSSGVTDTAFFFKPGNNHGAKVANA